MRVEEPSDDADVDAELALLAVLRPLARSDGPYRLLREAAGPNGIDRERVRELRRERHNAGRNLDLLTTEKLVRRDGTDRIVATPRGKRLVSAVQRAAETPPAGVLAGRRLLAVDGDVGGDLQKAEMVLKDAGADVLQSEGNYDLIGVLPDEFSLVIDLTRRLRQLGNRTTATRIIRRA